MTMSFLGAFPRGAPSGPLNLSTLYVFSTDGFLPANSSPKNNRIKNDSGRQIESWGNDKNSTYGKYRGCSSAPKPKTVWAQPVSASKVGLLYRNASVANSRWWPSGATRNTWLSQDWRRTSFQVFYDLHSSRYLARTFWTLRSPWPNPTYSQLRTQTIRVPSFRRPGMTRTHPFAQREFGEGS